MIETHREIVAPRDPDAIFNCCCAAGKDGWRLAGMMPMRGVVQAPLPDPTPQSGAIEIAIAAQSQGQVVEAMMLIFQREARPTPLITTSPIH